MKLFQQFFNKRFERTRYSNRSSHRSFENLEPRLAFDVDLSVSITNGQNTYVPGSDKVDTIIVQNLGSEAVTNARVVASIARRDIVRHVGGAGFSWGKCTGKW